MNSKKPALVYAVLSHWGTMDGEMLEQICSCEETAWSFIEYNVRSRYNNSLLKIKRAVLDVNHKEFYIYFCTNDPKHKAVCYRITERILF